MYANSLKLNEIRFQSKNIIVFSKNSNVNVNINVNVNAYAYLNVNVYIRHWYM